MPENFPNTFRFAELINGFIVEQREQLAQLYQIDVTGVDGSAINTPGGQLDWGDWVVYPEAEKWRAVYSVEKNANQSSELILEMELNGNWLKLTNWHVKEFF